MENETKNRFSAAREKQLLIVYLEEEEGRRSVAPLFLFYFMGGANGPIEREQKANNLM